MNFRDLVYRLYARRVEGRLDHDQVPKHIGVILDGNRRWAKASGGSAVQGHQAADKISELLGWCDETDVEVVTLWMLSTDNFDRPEHELKPLLGIIENTVRNLAADGRWRVHHVGTLDLLPAETQTVLKEAEEATSGIDGIIVNVAVGYGGRQEIADAVRSLLQEHSAKGTTFEELAEIVSTDLISEHLYTRGQPDPDLVIRTSGEQRLSGFMLWQSAHSEYYFCEVFWLGLPQGRLPAGAARLLRPPPPLRSLSAFVRTPAIAATEPERFRTYARQPPLRSQSAFVRPPARHRRNDARAPLTRPPVRPIPSAPPVPAPGEPKGVCTGHRASTGTSPHRVICGGMASDRTGNTPVRSTSGHQPGGCRVQVSGTQPARPGGPLRTKDRRESAADAVAVVRSAHRRPIPVRPLLSGSSATVRRTPRPRPRGYVLPW